MIMSPLVSIITVNLNNAQGLEKTIASAVNQTYTSVEVIVIDGASSDGSKTVIEKYSDRLKYWISERDNGVYNAMNKGILKSNGDYVLFLNSGDTFNSETGLASLINNGCKADIIFGDLVMVGEGKTRQVVFPDKVSFRFFLINSLPHPATLIKREIFDEIGLYNENYLIISDWLFFMLAICKYNYSYCHVPSFISNFQLGGLSSIEQAKIEEERLHALSKYFPAFLEDYKERDLLEKELALARKQIGYRVHNKLRKLF